MSLTSFHVCTLRSHAGVLPTLRKISNDLVCPPVSVALASSSCRYFSTCGHLHSKPSRKFMTPIPAAADGVSTATSSVFPSEEGPQAGARATTDTVTATPGALWSNERIEQFLHARRSLIRVEGTNRPLRAAETQSSPEGAPSEAEVTEARRLAEYLTSSPPRQDDWMIDTFLLCFQYELYDCCCELFFHHATHRDQLKTLPSSSRTNTSDREMLFGLAIDAAGRASEVPSLWRCYRFAMALQEGVAEESVRASFAFGVPSPGSSVSVLTPVTVHLCNLYWHCIRLSFSAEEKVRQSNLTTLTVQVLAALHVHEGAGTHLAHFMKASQHHYRYTDGERNKRAALSVQLFQHWSETLGSPQQPLRDWLDVAVLHHIVRAAVSSNRFDLVEYLTLYVDMLLLVPTAPTSPTKESPETFFMTRKREWDGVILTVLRYFSLSRQTARAVQWLRRLRQQHPDYRPSTPVCVAVARAAANAQDVELSTWCLETLLADQPTMPSARDWFDCICAVARSGLPNYKQVLQSLLENDLLRLTPEELLYVNLLHCRRSCTWREELELLLGGSVSLNGDSMTMSSEQGVPVHSEALAPTELLSSRNIHMALLILHEMEHPHFMRYYRYFLHLTAWRATPEERAKWCIFAVVWATTQMSHLRNDDVFFILQEYGQLLSHLERSPSEDGGRPAVLPRTAHSLQMKWSALYAQHPEWWWKKLIRKNEAAARARSNSARDSNPSVDLRSAVRPKQGTSAAFTARFLKRKQRVQLNVASLFLFDGVTERTFWHGDTSEVHKRDVWSSCFRNTIE